MNKKYYILFFVFTLYNCVFNIAHAQRISGIVSGQSAPLAGVSIVLKNHFIGTITNSEGKFSLLLPEKLNTSDSILFSGIGYAPLTMSVDNALKNKQALNITLTQLANNLNDVVVTHLSLQNLLDSIKNHNIKKFISPAILSAYYKETVYSDSLCTEFSDALCEYYYQHDFNKNSNKIRLKINASRCLSSTFINTWKNRDSMKIAPYSEINPIKAFQNALLYRVINRFFPKKNLPYYKYTMQYQDDSTIKIVIVPKKASDKYYHRLVLFLTKDFTLKHYRMDIPETALSVTKQKNLLSFHDELINFVIEVNYLMMGDKIYPNYFYFQDYEHFWGKLFGTTVNQKFDEKSEFVITKVDNSNTVKPFDNSETYTKGNICANGISMNDSLLTNYNVILPTQTERTIIKGMK